MPNQDAETTVLTIEIIPGNEDAGPCAPEPATHAGHCQNLAKYRATMLLQVDGSQMTARFCQQHWHTMLEFISQILDVRLCQGCERPIDQCGYGGRVCRMHGDCGCIECRFSPDAAELLYVERDYAIPFDETGWNPAQSFIVNPDDDDDESEIDL